MSKADSEATGLPDITIEDFTRWEEDIVTQHLMVHLREVIDLNKQARLDSSLIKSVEGIHQANYLNGYGDAIEEMLSLIDILNIKEAFNNITEDI